ncbi:MAG: thioredoxin family protein [Phycisphaerae bacterium]|nr:thioredoxin family protein [Phycisphaerae bacterium]
MAATPSTMLPLGTTMPSFSLLDPLSGQITTDANVVGRIGTLVMFLCNHCPFVKHIRSELSRLAAEYEAKGMGVVGISSNDAEAYPDDAPDKMEIEARAAGYVFPYLFDASQATAKAYRAACTPDFFLFDAARRLVYRGQLDDSRPKNGLPVTGRDLRAALDAVVAGRPVAAEQRPSIGCNIKWKPGNEPDYYKT